MKKHVMFVPVKAACSVTAWAQKLNESQVSTLIKQAFKKDYPGTSLKNRYPFFLHEYLVSFLYNLK